LLNNKIKVLYRVCVFAGVFTVVADSRQPALYGGRMTASRLFHVGQVTSEAVEQLHK